MFIEQFFIDGMGCMSYLIACEAVNEALVIDPDRDIRKYLDLAERKGFRISHIIETHLHADHVSGNRELAEKTGASIYIHEAAGAQFSHLPLKEGQVLNVGNIEFKILHTPGHTPESISILITDNTRSPEPWMLLSGDTLFVGDAGRPDLTGAEAARELAGLLYESIHQRLSRLPSSLVLYPGHGAGSLCGKSIGSVRVSTMGFEKQHNPVFSLADREEFVHFMSHNLPEQPANHQYIKKLNREGVPLLGEIEPIALTLEEAVPYLARGAALVDTRSKAHFVEKHIPGSVHLPLNGKFSNRAGFVLEPYEKIVLLLDHESHYQEVVYALARVGLDLVVGYLKGGIEVWETNGYPVTSGDIEDLTPPQLYEMLQNGNSPTVLDVREEWEYLQGRVPGSQLIPLGKLHNQIHSLDPEQPIAVICATGNRSQSAAALLGQNGFKKIYNVVDGISGWIRHGFPIEN